MPSHRGCRLGRSREAKVIDRLDGASSRSSVVPVTTSLRSASARVVGTRYARVTGRCKQSAIVCRSERWGMLPISSGRGHRWNGHRAPAIGVGSVLGGTVGERFHRDVASPNDACLHRDDRPCRVTFSRRHPGFHRCASSHRSAVRRSMWISSRRPPAIVQGYVLRKRRWPAHPCGSDERCHGRSGSIGERRRRWRATP